MASEPPCLAVRGSRGLCLQVMVMMMIVMTMTMMMMAMMTISIMMMMMMAGSQGLQGPLLAG